MNYRKVEVKGKPVVGFPVVSSHEKELNVKDYYVTLKFRNGSVKTVRIPNVLDVFEAEIQAVSIFGGVIATN